MIKQLLGAALLAVSLNNPPKRVSENYQDFYKGTYSVDVDFNSNQNNRNIVGVFSFPFTPANDDVWIDENNDSDWESTIRVPELPQDYVSYVKLEVGSVVWEELGFDYTMSFLVDGRGDLPSNMVSYFNSMVGSTSITSGISSGLGNVNISASSSDQGGGETLVSVYVSVELNDSSEYGEFTITLQEYVAPPVVTHSVSFLLNHCTTQTAYPVVVEQGQAFTATFTAMSGYAFKGDNVSEYFDYPQGALNPVYQVSNIVGDYGSYWRSVTITAVVWADCTLTISPAPLDEVALQDAYDRGYSDAKTTYENTNQFAWLKSIWTGMASFFAIEILPNISLGFLAFAPLLVVAIIAIVRILKHD